MINLRPLTPALMAAGLGLAPKAFAADTVRRLIIEGDAIAPVSATYESHSSDVTTSKYGVQADFNIAARMSTGPEYWTGAFNATGPKDGSPVTDRDNLMPGERHKIEASRLRWMVGLWEQSQSMRGWYLKAGYSYTKIQSRANRYNDLDAASAPDAAESLKETDIVTDTRHGVALELGNRWMFLDQHLTLTVGTSFTQNFKREVTVDSEHGTAREQYEKMIANLPDTKISTRPIPELNVNIGYAF